MTDEEIAALVKQHITPHFQSIGDAIRCYLACHEAHVNCENDLAACQRMGDSQRERIGALETAADTLPFTFQLAEYIHDEKGYAVLLRVDRDQWDAYKASHSELVRANNDLAACREVANGLRKDLDKEREAYTVLRSNTLILRAKVNTLESVLLQMHHAIAQYFPLGEMPRSFLVAVERYVGLPL
jgi:hypothetical protein